VQQFLLENVLAPNIVLPVKIVNTVNIAPKMEALVAFVNNSFISKMNLLHTAPLPNQG
jgi:hypothetical protein